MLYIFGHDGVHRLDLKNNKDVSLVFIENDRNKSLNNLDLGNELLFSQEYTSSHSKTTYSTHGKAEAEAENLRRIKQLPLFQNGNVSRTEHVDTDASLWSNKSRSNLLLR